LQNQIDEYVTKLENGFNLNDKDRENLLKSFKEFADSNRGQIIDTISKIEPNRNDFFWNFCESICTNVNGWKDFILSKFKDLLIEAEKLNDPNPIIQSIEGFELFTEENDSDFMKEMRNLILSFINTSNNRFRRFVVWMLTSYTYENNKYERDLIKNLKNDKDWKIRYYALSTDNELNGYELEKGLSVLDKLRNKFLNVYEY